MRRVILKKIILGIIIVIVIIVGSIISVFYSQSLINPNSLGVANVTVNNNKIAFRIDNFGSALGLVKYTTEYKNEVLYIKVYGALKSLSKPFNNISIDNTYGKIKEIYLQGNTPVEKKLIYPEIEKSK